MNEDAQPVPPPLPAPLSESVEPASPWGFWATAGMGLLIGICYIIAQTIGFIAFLAATGELNAASLAKMEQLVQDGRMVALVTLLSAPVAIGGCILFAWLRHDLSLRDYFALHWPEGKIALRWTGLFMLFFLAAGYVMSFFGGDVTEKFVREMYHSAGNWRPLLWLALFIIAPVSEEFLFRGFLLTGFAASRLGEIGGILVTSLAFASIHMQYDWHGLLFVFLVGVFFGAARVKTNSLPLCMALHALMNLISITSTIYFE